MNSLFTDIYVDMDGVVADWHLHAANTMKRYLPGTVLPQSALDIARAFDAGAPIAAFMPRADFGVWTENIEWWTSIPDIDKRFPSCPHVKDLFQLLGGYKAHTHILSAMPGPPFKSGSAACAGKMQWLHTRLGHDFGDIILCAKKSKRKVANPTSVLIDDSKENVESFAKAGGAGILYCAWNINPGAVIGALADARPGQVVET